MRQSRVTLLSRCEQVMRLPQNYPQSVQLTVPLAEAGQSAFSKLCAMVSGLAAVLKTCSLKYSATPVIQQRPRTPFVQYLML